MVYQPVSCRLCKTRFNYLSAFEKHNEISHEHDKNGVSLPSLEPRQNLENIEEFLNQSKTKNDMESSNKVNEAKKSENTETAAKINTDLTPKCGICRGQKKKCKSCKTHYNGKSLFITKVRTL